MNVEMSFKYNEDALLQELRDYIAGTYNQHYSSGNDSIQTLDLIEACGDIVKILHYGLLLLHFSDQSTKREEYPNR